MPDGDTIPFTLEVNPYRAALIVFAQNKGELSLVPFRTQMRRRELSPQVQKWTVRPMTR